MADPPVISADPAGETPAAKQGDTPSFFRDMSRDAFLSDEASDTPSTRKDGRGAYVRDGSPVGKLRLSVFTKDEQLFDFNPLENLAYTGGKKISGGYEEVGFEGSTAPTAEDDFDHDGVLVDIEKETPSPNADSRIYTEDPGNPSVNQPRFPRRKFTRWIDVALNEEFGGQEWSVYEIHVPDGFNAELAKITILFGVGGDLNRHGVRSFFKGSTDTIIINVPGTEGYRTDPANHEHIRPVRGDIFTGKHWGVGITREQIERLLKSANVTVPWEISVLAAFSTGYRGLYATIMNTRDVDDEIWVEDEDPSLPWCVTAMGMPDIRLKHPLGTYLGSAISNLKRLVIFDCLYQDDTAKVGKPNLLSGVLTHLAKLASKRGAASPIELLVYDATTAGSSKQLRPFDTQIDVLKLASDVKDTYKLDLRCLRQRKALATSPESIEWLGVIVCRLLREGLADELIDPAMFAAKLDTKNYKAAKPTIEALLARLGEPAWKRGTILSSDTGTSTQKSYREFFASPAERTAFSNVMELLRRDFLTPFFLLAWPPGNLGEIAHDGLLIEFGWEGLLG